MKDFWESLSGPARAGFVVGLVLIVAMSVMGARWSLNKDYQVLFSELNDQDAAAMVSELDRMKQPYELAADGSKILVPRESVHKTRLHLVSKNLPTHGGVGFEIFNNTDYGMTEFTQKVNYQRALQGELTRTILALDEVQTARVHLVLPESGLFKRAENRAKASVTLALKAGRDIEKEQILGIQRLVAASVPDIDPRNVTVLNSSGVALSPSASTQALDSGDWKLETKRQTEDYLTRKLSSLITRAIGTDRAAVSVDVLLDYDNVKTTDEEVLAAPGSEPGERAAGVLVRERQTSRSSKPAKAEGASESDVTNFDSEYQAGRRVHQIISTPGSVRRIAVGVVLPPGIDATQIEKLRELVSAAAGIDKARGDGVVIHAITPGAEQVTPSAGVPDLTPTGSLSAPTAIKMPGAQDSQPMAFRWPSTLPLPLPWLLGLGMVAVLVLLAGLRLVARRSPPALERTPAAPQLNDEQRQQLLIDLRGWLAEPSVSSRG